MVLLDEPSSGIAQREIEALGPLLRLQAETGCSLVVIEHDMALLSSLCDGIVALEQGAVIAGGTPAQVLSDARVISSYLGTNEDVVHRSGRRGTTSSYSGVAPRSGDGHAGVSGPAGGGESSGCRRASSASSSSSSRWANDPTSVSPDRASSTRWRPARARR